MAAAPPGGAIIASTRCTGSGMSKWTPLSSAVVRSSRSWSQAWNASTPSMLRVGSCSRCSITAGIGSPASTRSATLAMAASMRASSAQPHAYVSGKSKVVPVNARAMRAYRSAPTASWSVADGPYSSTRKRPSDAYAVVARWATSSSRARSAG